MPQIMEATAIMEKARSWFADDLKIMGNMDVRLVMHIHGFAKKVETRKQYPSLKAIAQDLVRDVQLAGGNISASPWKVPADAPTAPAQPDASSTRTAASAQTIVEFAADGSLDIGQLKSVFGFELGSTVQLKTGSGTVFHIAKLEDEGGG